MAIISFSKKDGDVDIKKENKGEEVSKVRSKSRNSRKENVVNDNEAMSQKIKKDNPQRKVTKNSTKQNKNDAKFDENSVENWSDESDVIVLGKEQPKVVEKLL